MGKMNSKAREALERFEEGREAHNLTVAVKADEDKPRTDLLAPEAMIGMSKVLAFGANKYADHNWRKGFLWSRLVGAALRHLFAFMSGEDLDPETGLPHVDHLACCVMFLSAHQKSNLGEDDRWQKQGST